MEHKRLRDADGEDDQGSHKAPRVADAMAALDIRVVNRLDDMVAAGQIAHGDLDAKALGELSRFEASDALQILDQFQHSGLENVRNKSAYLHGVMVRFKKETGPHLEPDIDSRLDRLFRSGKVKAKDLDSKCYEALNQLPPHVAVRVIDRFQNKVSDEVRNMSAFFMSLLRQEQQNAGYDARVPGGPPAPPGGYGGYRDEPGPRYQRQYEPFPEPYPDDHYGGPPRMPPPHYPPAPHHHPPPPGHNPVSAGPQVLVISPDQLQQLQQPSGAVSLQALLPQILAAIQQQQQPALPAPPPQQHHVPQPQLQPIPAPAPAQPSYQSGAGGRKSYAVEQAAMGVRVTEFHGLSYFSEYVHPAPALKLQQLWDGGNRLVSLLDDRTWEALAQLPAPEALAVIDQVVENMKRQELRNPNAFFMSCAKRFLEKQRNETGQQQGQYPGPSPRPYAQHPPAAPRGPGGHHRASSGTPGGALAALPDHLHRLALDAIARHHPVLTESVFDEGVIEYMKRLSHEDGVGVFEELMAADLSNVRNVPAYLMGMIRKRRHDGQARR